MAAGNTFAFEFRVQGTVNGAPYANWNAMFFEVEDDKIRRWREYIDDLDLETIKAFPTCKAGAGRSGLSYSPRKVKPVIESFGGLPDM